MVGVNGSQTVTPTGGNLVNILVGTVLYIESVDSTAVSALQTGFNANSRIRFESTSNPL